MQRICFSASQASVQNPNSHHLCLISISITVSWRLGKKRIKSKGFSYLGSSCVHGAKYTMVTWSEIESIIYSSLRGFLKINFFNVSTLGKLLNSVFIFLFFPGSGLAVSLYTIDVQKGSKWSSDVDRCWNLDAGIAGCSSLLCIYGSAIAPGQYWGINKFN